MLENKILCSTSMFQKRYSMRQKRFSKLSDQYEVVEPIEELGSHWNTEVARCWKKCVLRARDGPFFLRA